MTASSGGASSAPALNAWQTAAVEHGTPAPALPVDMSHVVVRERDADLRYGERLLPSDAEPSIAGYAEVYRRTDNGLWFSYHESDGGSRWSNGKATMDEAWADLAASLARSHAYWRVLVGHAERGDRDEFGRRVIRCRGTHYIVGAEPQPGQGKDGLGFGGHRWHFRLLDGQEVISHNLWRQGRIPREYRDRLPDNAEQIPLPVRSLLDPPAATHGSADEGSS